VFVSRCSRECLRLHTFTVPIPPRPRAETEIYPLRDGCHKIPISLIFRLQTNASDVNRVESSSKFECKGLWLLKKSIFRKTAKIWG